MEEQGVRIYSVTPQNEPLNRGNSASMFMGWQEQNVFIKEALGPKLREAGLDTKIYLYDHNYDYDRQKEDTKDQGQYPLHIYADAETSQYVSGAAYHNYGGDKGELRIIHDANPAKELIFTETSIGEWNDGRNFEKHLIEDMEEVVKQCLKPSCLIWTVPCCPWITMSLPASILACWQSTWLPMDMKPESWWTVSGPERRPW